MSTSWKRWVPAAAVPLVVVAAAVTLPLSASAAGDLPEKSAADLLTFVAESDTTAFSGEVQQTSALGLPDLSALGSTGSGAQGTDDASATSALMELATGSHQARVFVDAEHGARLQVLDRLAERDVVATKADGVWIYDSAENSATHLLPPTGATSAPPTEAPAGEIPTPSSVAEQLLASIDPTTTVAVGSDVRVAGRDAYELVLTPRDSSTLVGSVTVSIDGETGLPLGVAVTPVGGTAPAFSVAYTSIDVSAPDAAMFSFTPPVGAEVVEKAAPTHEQDAATDATDVPAAPEGDSGVTTTGTGWGSIVELPSGDAESLAQLNAVTTAVDGGRVLSSALFTVLFTDDGRVLAGAVPVDALTAAAGR
jgi:outer membrane lipoprotein-sorting protein